MASVRAMLHECDGSHLQFVFWQALIRFAHSVASAQRVSACGGGSLQGHARRTYSSNCSLKRFFGKQSEHRLLDMNRDGF